MQHLHLPRLENASEDSEIVYDITLKQVETTLALEDMKDEDRLVIA